MFVRGRLVAVAVGLAMTAGGATGCGGSGSKPVALPSITTTPATASPSPTASAAQLAAITAVVRRYFELINGPTTLAGARDLYALMSDRCSCRRAARSMEDAARKRQHYFGRASVRNMTPSIDGARAADVLVVYNFSRAGLADSSGRVVSASAARTRVSLDFRLLLASGTWLIDDVQIVSNGTAA